MSRLRRHSIELFFDETTERVLQEELGGLRDAGLPSPLLHWGTRPHISVLLGSAMHEDAPDALAAFASEFAPVPVTLSVLGTFPGNQGTVIHASMVDPARNDLGRIGATEYPAVFSFGG